MNSAVDVAAVGLKIIGLGAGAHARLAADA
jgi:hypothetical protein